jgi:hypothetical protein
MKFANLMDRHKGETCWIVGTGPSLDAIDPADITGPRIYLNRAAFALPAERYVTYWLVADDAWGQQIEGPWSEHLRNVIRGDADTILLARNPLLVPSGAHTKPHDGPHIVHWKSQHAPRAALRCMTRTEIAECGELYSHCGTAAPAIHAAWFMGCTRIILTGIDGTDGHAACLEPYYTQRPRKGGLGYMTSRGDAIETAAALNMEIDDRSVKQEIVK